MVAITIEVDEQTQGRLRSVSLASGIPDEQLAREALVSYIEDLEDFHLAEGRLRDNLPAIPLEKVVQQLGLED
ncbi:MAG: type II toxin-antitoxin system RelB family antitoxin [Gammaproteobacteria bacterium]